ncbi:MAG: LLM class flavin-dependent oxidoreductase, partial [Candidatus Ranarchaeia archaeon]
ETAIAEECKFWFDPPQPIPVYFGCQRPWMLRLAGEIGDGVLINHGTKEHLPWSIARLHEGAERIDRDLKADGFEILNLSPAAVAEDRKTAYEWVKSSIPYVFLNMDKWHMKDLGITRKDFKAVRDPITVQNEEGFRRSAAAVEEWMIKKFSVAGTPEDCIRHIKEYLKAGVDGVALGVPTHPKECADTTLTLLRDHVLPVFR